METSVKRMAKKCAVDSLRKDLKALSEVIAATSLAIKAKRSPDLGSASFRNPGAIS